MACRNMRSKHQGNRRGLAAVEWAVIAGGISIAGILAITSLGSATRQKLTTTGQDIGNPANLPAKFVKGNNGLGNGIDGAPSGKAPENDGEGTGPGNPGARSR